MKAMPLGAPRSKGQSQVCRNFQTACLSAEVGYSQSVTFSLLNPVCYTLLQSVCYRQFLTTSLLHSVCYDQFVTISLLHSFR